MRTACTCVALPAERVSARRRLVVVVTWGSAHIRLPCRRKARDPKNKAEVCERQQSDDRRCRPHRSTASWMTVCQGPAQKSIRRWESVNRVGESPRRTGPGTSPQSATLGAAQRQLDRPPRQHDDGHAPGGPQRSASRRTMGLFNRKKPKTAEPEGKKSRAPANTAFRSVLVLALTRIRAETVGGRTDSSGSRHGSRCSSLKQSCRPSSSSASSLRRSGASYSGAATRSGVPAKSRGRQADRFCAGVRIHHRLHRVRRFSTSGRTAGQPEPGQLCRLAVESVQLSSRDKRRELCGATVAVCQ